MLTTKSSMKIWPYIILAAAILFVAIILLWDIPLFRKTSPRTKMLIKAIDNITNRPDRLEPWVEKFVESLSKFTLPIKDICEEGELVEDVSKRLEREGNADKISRFKKYVDSTIALQGQIYVFLKSRRDPEPSVLKSRNLTRTQMMNVAMESILKNPGKTEPWVKEFVKTIPKFTFPIEGICKDGELVGDVLKRLEEEGDAKKIAYFRKYMNLDE